ncbi:MAG TPA: hypothetical protein VGM31_03260, partial [Puia sp.]
MKKICGIVVVMVLFSASLTAQRGLSVSRSPALAGSADASHSSDAAGFSDPAGPSGFARWKLSDFAIDLNKLLTPPAQLWVGSGYCTVNPVPGSVLGTADLMSPPISGRGLSLEALFIANGDSIRDRFVWGSKPNNILYTGGNWQPDQVIRRGIYHRMHPGGPISFVIVSHLIPLADRAGFMIRYEVKNLGTSRLDLKMIPLLRPGRPSVQPLKKWGFIAP